MSSSRPTRISLFAIAAAATAVVLAGCGGDDGGDTASGPAAAVPADAVFYAEAVVRPEGDELTALTDLAGSVAPIEDPSAFAKSQIDSFFANEGVDLTYAADIEPWLGERAGFALLGATDDEAYLFALETSDEDAARATLEKIVANTDETETEATSGDVEYYQTEDGTAVGVTDGLVLFANQTDFERALSALDGDSLADSDQYATELDSLADDRLVTVYADPGSAVDAAMASGEVSEEEQSSMTSFLGDALEQPFLAALTVAADSLGLEASAGEIPGFTTGASELINELPGDAWIAVALPDVGTTITNAFDQLGSLGAAMGEPGLTPEDLTQELEGEFGIDVEELLAGIGDLAVYLRGTSDDQLNIGAILELSDTSAASELAKTLREAAQAQPGSGIGNPLDPAAEGFSTEVSGDDPGNPFHFVNVEVTEGRVEVEVAADRATAEASAPGTLSEDAEFQSAAEGLGDDFGVSFYVAAQTAVEFARGSGAVDESEYAAVAPFFEKLGYLISGARAEDGRILSRIVLGLAD